MRFLITAGPTREYLDSVRYFSNGSSGKMGYACAASAVQRGHKAVLISGPVDLAAPKGVRRVMVISAEQMWDAVMREFSRCDAVIMTAAVCDYRPKKTQRYKVKKGEGNLILELKRTPDILAGLGLLKKNQVLIGFAVEDQRGKANARRKFVGKNLDAIILNRPASIGADRSEFEMLTVGEKWQSLGILHKMALAKKLVVLAEKMFAAKK
jgi:phosphopantothenoylcysteine decarboxylase / phosphopantothenate---cysteine ligase